jgi:ribosomal protein S18 acetylase RimI-like enzyme
VFERFTDDARRVVVLAQEECRLLDHDHVGTEHILLGLLHEGGHPRRQTRAGKALASLNLSLETVREQVREIAGEGGSAPATHIPFTPRAKKVLEAALRETSKREQSAVGGEHLLLGLIRVEDGVAVTVLHELGVEGDQVRIAVDRVLDGRDPSFTTMSDVRLRAMRADEWDAWYAWALPEYADDLVRNESLAPEDALAQVAQETDALLPDGLATPRHHLLVAEDAGDGRRVGHLWFGPRVRDPDPGVAWLYDIFVEETDRGRGVGRAMMLLFEQEAHAGGFHRIELNVFGDNAHAQRLYESLAYVEMARQMGKDLDEAGAD